MPDIFFSIVTPTWNSGAYLKETVKAVLEQSETSWEWIIADDASTDGTREYLKELSGSDPRITIIELQKTNNPAVSRNTCINRSSGRVICFLDHDDLWDPLYLEKLKTAYLNHPVNCAFSGHNFYRSDKDITPAPTQVREGGELEAGLLIRSLFDRNRIALSAFTIERSFIKSIGLMDGSNEVWASCDYELYLRALRHGAKFYFINEFLVNYRLLASSMSASLERNITNRIFVIERIKEDKKFYSDYFKEINSFQNKVQFQLSICHVLDRRKNWRRELIVSVIRYYGTFHLLKTVRWIILGLLPWRLSINIINYQK